MEESWEDLLYEVWVDAVYAGESDGWKNSETVITILKRIRDLETELDEQARLHGMGSEREAKQLSRISELVQQCKKLRAERNAVRVKVEQPLLLRIRELESDNAELRRLLTRYRNETPLGHQPHMIAHEADKVLAALENSDE